MERQTTDLLDAVAHKVYGVPQTINSANYAYFLAAKEASSLATGEDGLGESVTAVILGKPT